MYKEGAKVETLTFSHNHWGFACDAVDIFASLVLAGRLHAARRRAARRRAARRPAARPHMQPSLQSDLGLQSILNDLYSSPDAVASFTSRKLPRL